MAPGSDEFFFHNDEQPMKHDDFLIPYDAQCQHGNRYDYCSICSGAQDDFELACYLLADEWFDGEPRDIDEVRR